MTARISSYCGILIERQSGVLARWQVASRNPSDAAAIDSLLRSGRWQGLYRGVYAAYTGTHSRPSILWAAVLRCGSQAALSHYTAAELDRLTDPRDDVVHVTIPGQLRVWLSDRDSACGLPRVVVHRSSRLESARHPARTPPRTRIEETVLDLTGIAVSADAAFGWLTAACGRRLTTPGQLRAAIAHRPRLRWRREILAALGDISTGVLSHLERDYLRGVEQPHGLPAARRQVRLRRRGGSAYLDNLYEPFGVGVELDGQAAHRPEDRWRDIRRDNQVATAGIVTLRYSWADVTSRPCLVAAEVARVLRLRGWTGAPRPCGPACLAVLGVLPSPPS